MLKECIDRDGDSPEDCLEGLLDKDAWQWLVDNVSRAVEQSPQMIEEAVRMSLEEEEAFVEDGNPYQWVGDE